MAVTATGYEEEKASQAGVAAPGRAAGSLLPGKVWCFFASAEVHNAHRIEMRGDSMRKSRGELNT